MILGHELPGLLVQVPLDLAFSAILFQAIARKLAREEPVALGVGAGTLLSLALAVAAVVTLSDEAPSRMGWYWGYGRETEQAFALRYVLLFVTLLQVAADAAVPREAIVRGLARRGAGPREDERTNALLPVAAAAAVASVFTLGLVVAVEAFAVVTTQTVATTPLVVAGVVLVSAVAVASQTFQASRLLFPNGTPNAIAAGALLALWLAPIFASSALREVGAPPFVIALPLIVCPFSTIDTCAAEAAPNRATWEVSPVSLGIAAIFVNVLIAGGLEALIRGALALAREEAGSLVALPADAFAAPQGGLGKTCARGHVFAETWDACPHCR
jgi:hypothetical protein